MGIQTHVIDSAETLDDQPRAIHYGTAAVHELARAGVLDDIQAEGLICRNFCWRKLDGEVIAGLDSTLLDGTLDQVTCLPLNQVSKIVMKHILEQPTARVSWGHNVTDIGQTDEEAWVEVETCKETKRLTADYIVGCDGARSIVRRKLFGVDDFPGHTLEEQIVATNTYYDFDKYGYQDSNSIIHPEHWHMAARISNDGLWRVSYGELAGLSRGDVIARQPEKSMRILPGSPSPGQYQLVNISPYRVHQRLARSMRVGRFLLTADAAHLCNPFGGLGLTGGIVDVAGLSDRLSGIYDGNADESILDEYSRIRREKYLSMVNPISLENIGRLHS
ncbi:FAD/NAD(P)-binding domain-containing protein [Aureobasidium namibiae CBS 147.97]|uniref:FAD/NAD(P)-binding domain-containing protein n=1 Tax=Aureobasidium namibiae CBS 147.97 TaxID=1043004 RepID=A0A074WWP2_9PEZI|nr:FAD/NAD(P)-binding domain-containing protein [Aureobasidium namibiae CBS 147.97]KEQ74157.1 FAD/NAD(P)-binding domain-containing protein [Aureobasidium namibiae CBS 147.97]